MLGYKATNDTLTLLFGGNSSSDMKLKALLVYHSESAGFGTTVVHLSWGLL